ncbi:hypothetical protein [Pseudalkalibacillus caeni]|uniref:hypothetical protein n=1 Tax=Exobacillus caeni TaxID=2574798 RepID=UPI00148566BF|nr:hypothetical protein [Pseudalkalibacillus caeni]
MARKAGRRRKKVERFLSEEFKKVETNVTKQSSEITFQYPVSDVRVPELHETPLNPL